MEELKSPFAARRISSEGRTVVLHAEDHWLKDIRDGSIDFFVKLSQRLARDGLTTRLVALGGSTSRSLLAQDHVNIIVGKQPAYAPNILHALPAYIWGFWYLDEIGVNWNSSLRFARFCPDQIDGDKAGYFFNGVTGYMLRENVSRISQEVRVNQPMQRAAAVIYCQELEHLQDRCHFLTTEDMIRSVAEANRDDLIYVKMHPNQSKSEKRRIMAICSDYTNAKITDASVHDLTAVSRVVVTQNSAAGFEALMQKKTVITCARSDYWHATLTPRSKKDLAEAVTYGPEVMGGFDYEKYFYWFLDRNCLEPQKDEFPARAMARIRNKFFL